MGPMVFTICNQDKVFIINLTKLRYSFNLNEILKYIFMHNDIIILGYKFYDDINAFVQKLPNLTFINKILNFIDVPNYYSDVVHENYNR